METLFLIIYILLAVLLILLIIATVKLFAVVDKLNETLDEIQKKLRQMDTTFKILNGVTNAIQSFVQSASFNFVKFFSKSMFKKK